MAIIRKVRAPFGANIRVKKGERLSAPKRSVITITTEGGKRMPRRVQKKKPAKKAGPAFSIPGQKGTGIVKGSQWRISREPDQFTIKRPPKKPKVRYV